MRRVRGSATVEMAYIMPVVFFTFIVVMYILFYLHDKNILNGAGYETLVVGNQRLRWDEENMEEQMEEVFQERIKGKMIFFSGADVEVKCEGEMLTIRAKAKRNGMKITVEQKSRAVRPEKFIRDLRRVHGN